MRGRVGGRGRALGWVRLATARVRMRV